MTLMEDVTLVVPARGRPNRTRGLLESLVESGANYPILLVDDANPVPLDQSLPYYPGLNLRMLRNRSNVGPSASRNVGILNVRTPFVSFTDNDVTVTNGLMSRLHAHLAAAPRDVAGVGGRVVDDGRNLVGSYSTCLGLLNPYNRKGRVMYLVTANCIFRRSALLEIGGFDETFHVPGGEDSDLSFRLMMAGYRIEYDSDAVVVHHYEGSWRAFYRMFKRYGQGCRRAMDCLTRGPRNPR